MRNLWICVGLLVLTLLSPSLRADQGDVEGSRDYPGFTRLPGFFISDYDEDNPSAYDFPIARPTPTDADHVEIFHVKGHRYIIRYELTTEEQISILKTQQYYEQLAADAGFTAEKTGATGDVTETFHRRKGSHDIWVRLEPGMAVDVITVVESSGPAPPPPGRPAAMATPAPKETQPVGATPAPKPKRPRTPTPVAPPPGEEATERPSTPAPISEDALYDALESKGRVVLPVSFLPGKPDIDSDAQPLINRVVNILKKHPELALIIEGHTDDTGDASDNLRLSAERARAVRGLLVAGGINKRRLIAEGKGGSHPLADNDTAEGREKNRRIELVVREDPAAIHPAAPNGTNYYPKPDAGTP